MVSRALFLHRLGYSVLLIDFQAHGETPGRQITFGYLESRDVVAALNYLKTEFPEEKFGVIGVSMGAAAFVLADKRPRVDAAVLESMYPTIEQAVRDRLSIYLGPFGPTLAPSLTAELAPRLGLRPADLRPIDHIQEIDCPLLVINGTADRHTRIDETRDIFQKAHKPKELWEVQGASHVNLHRFASAEYEQRITEFFARYLSR